MGDIASGAKPAKPAGVGCMALARKQEHRQATSKSCMRLLHFGPTSANLDTKKLQVSCAQQSMHSTHCEEHW